jgi:hypothetical protein
MRRTGFLATLAAGIGLLGASFYGFADMDRELKVAAAPKPSPELLLEQQPPYYHPHDCDRAPGV